MRLKRFVVGALEVNCWIVSDDHSPETMIIDPGDEPDRIGDYVKEHHLKVKYLVCTHSHFDHVGALPELKDALGAAVVLHKAELPLYERAAEMSRLWGFQVEKLPAPDRFVADGEKLEIGKLTFSVLHTPGHSPGGICLVGHGAAFTGDALFAGSIGRTDLPGGDYSTLMASLGKLVLLPEETAVHTGHGPSTTMGREKKMNPFIADRLP